MRISHLLLALLVVMIWGFNFVVIKVALNELPPLTLCCTRFFLASVPAIFFIKRPNLPLRLLAGYGVTMFALQFTLLFAGIYAGMPSGLASLLLHIHVFFTIILAALILREETHLFQITGAVICFSGIAIVGYHTDGSIPFWGFVFVLAAAFSWGVGNIISKKIGGVNMLSLVIWGNFIALPPLLLLTLYVEGTHPIMHVIQHMHWSLAATLFYLAYPTTIFGFAVWSWLLHRYSVATVTPFSLLVPVFGIMSTCLVLGEPLQEWKVVAAIFVITGLCVNLLGPLLTSKLRKAAIVS